jgi:hypothetical protein
MIKCKNINCANHCDNNTCKLKNSYITASNTCNNFKKGFLYYFYCFEDAMGDSNFILALGLKDDVRYSIFYLMKVLPIEFAYDDIRGIITLREIGTTKPLSAKDIYDMIQSDKINEQELRKCIEDFTENGLPTSKNEPEDREYKTQEYGWLSPTGVFTESPFGSHEESAFNIVKHKGWIEEYEEWIESRDNKTVDTNYRDFLQLNKGYALIHDPSGLGYIVTNQKNLTKKQKNFLFNYFSDMGNKLAAEKYVAD